MPTAIAVISTRPPAAYDAEYHIGLIPWLYDETTLLWNTQRLNDALANMWNGGNFEFTHGESGPVLYPISFPGKTYYFRPPIRTSKRVGGAMFGVGAGSYILPEYYFTSDANAYIGGLRTRLVGVNDTGQNEPVLILGGNGFELRGFDIYGSRYIGNEQPVGDLAVACIQMEGGNWPVAQGQHVIGQCLLASAKYGLQLLGGYYDADNDYAFVADESHADMFTVEDTMFQELESAVRSENAIGAFGSKFSRLIFQPIGTPEGMVLFDWVKGGCITVDTLTINHGKFTLLKIDEYSPHNCNFEFRNIYVDRDPTPRRTNYVTLVSYVGDSYYEVTDTEPWRIRIGGIIGEYNKSKLDTSRLLYFNPDSPLKMDTSGIFIDVINVPKTALTLAGDGPYYSVNETVANYLSEVQDMSAEYKLDENTGTTATENLATGIDGTVSGTATWTNNASQYDNKFRSRTITTASWAANVATFTCNSHGFEASQTITVSNVSPSGYNGVYTITAKNTNTFSVALNSNPGAYVSGGKARHAADGGGLYMASTAAYLNIPEATENKLYVNSTIAFWIYLNSWTDGVVLSRVNTGVNNKSGFRTTSGGQLWLTEGGQNHLDFASGVGANLFTTKAWFHIAVSLDGGLAYKAYLNGVQCTPAGGDPGTMTGGEWLSMSLPLRAGAPSNAFYGSGSNASDVVVDDIRLYKRILSNGAITELHNIGNSL